jgi:hypothetical protein
MSDSARRPGATPDPEAPRTAAPAEAGRQRQPRAVAGREVRRGAERKEAQARANRIRAFRAELAALDAAGVSSLTTAQREAIDRYHDSLLQRLTAEHDIDGSEAAGQLSRGMQIASFIAAMALTAAVYSLVARFWGRLELPMQATLLCAFPLMALVGVELSARRERTLYIASIFALVAFGTYWLAVFALSELLNIPVTPFALWGGALFGVALAVAYGFRVIFGGALVALLIALAGSVFQAAGTPWTLFLEFPEIIVSGAFLLALAASRRGVISEPFAAVMRGVAFGVGFLGLLLLSSAGPASLLPLSIRSAELVYQGVMLVACGVVLMAAIRAPWTETVYITAAALTIFLCVRFVDWFWDVMPRFVFFLLLAALAFAWLLALRRLRTRLHASREALE